MAFHFPERNQNFWQLTCIQSASQCVPCMLVGGILAKEFGSYTAILSICIGNLILWLIGLGVISMAAAGRKNAIETVRGFLGKGSGIAVALLLIFAFLTWYMLEIQSAMTTISPIFQSATMEVLYGFGAVLGVVVAVLSMGGITLIRRLTVYVFPFLLAFVIYEILASDFSVLASPWGFSFTAIATVVSILFPGMVNLPTFFRHSHSRADSIVALTLITIFDAVFQIFTVFTQMTVPADLITKHNFISDFPFYPIIVFVFIIMTLICINLVNIYFASAGLEMIAPRLANKRGYLLIGLLGTVVFLIIRNPQPMFYLESLVDNFIANLGVVLLISYLTRVAVKHRPRTYEKLISSVCWTIGCIATLIVQYIDPQHSDRALIAGISGSLFAFLIVLFVEETYWSVKKLTTTQKV